jgi:hypothetical protein
MRRLWMAVVGACLVSSGAGGVRTGNAQAPGPPAGQAAPRAPLPESVAAPKKHVLWA